MPLFNLLEWDLRTNYHSLWMCPPSDVFSRPSPSLKFYNKKLIQNVGKYLLPFYCNFIFHCRKIQASGYRPRFISRSMSFQFAPKCGCGEHIQTWNAIILQFPASDVRFAGWSERWRENGKSLNLWTLFGARKLTGQFFLLFSLSFLTFVDFILFFSLF